MRVSGHIAIYFFTGFLSLMFPMFFDSAVAITGEDILRKVDHNLDFGSAIIRLRMEIYLPNQPPRMKILKAWIVGEEKAYVEFLNREDQNIRYLKLGKKLWVYDRSENNTILISGHLLKQGMMGSDVSYEDVMESEDIYEKYSISLEGEENVGGRDCYVVVLRAKVKDVSYHTRKMWIDKEYFIPLREEMYAVSGRLLKVAESEDIRSYKNRYYPAKRIVSDKLKANTKTIVSVEEVEFDVRIPDSIFTKRHLER